MVLEGKIRVHLEDKEVKIHKPKGFFAKLENALTGGSLERIEEIEGITILTFINEVSRALRKNNITNIVKLSVDDQVVYEDLEGIDNDLQVALDNLSYLEKREEIDEIIMILEHLDNNLKYVITIYLDRFHSKGKPPLEISIKGLPMSLSKESNESDDAFKSRIEKDIFTSKERFLQFQEQMESTMDGFVKNIEKSFQKKFKVDDTESAYRVKYPHRSEQREQVPSYYYGFSPMDMFFTYMFWDMMTSHHYYPPSNVNVIDDNGESIGTMDESGDFNELVDPELESGSVWDEHSEQPVDSGESWLEGTSFFDDDSSSFDSGSSSCSSCSSCSGD